VPFKDCKVDPEESAIDVRQVQLADTVCCQEENIITKPTAVLCLDYKDYGCVDPKVRFEIISEAVFLVVCNPSMNEL
jgi:hypothetical protein